MRTAIFGIVLFAGIVSACSGGDEKPTPIGDPNRTIKVDGQTIPEPEYVAREQARIAQYGKSLVCGPGLDFLKGIKPRDADMERAIELETKICAAAK